MTVLDFAPTSDRATTDRATSDRTQTPMHARVATVQLHDDLWRITRHDGEVLGYIERSSSQAGERFLAKRMLHVQRRFLPIGEFWSLGDALECFRF
jgi:hypothetical protein